MLSLPTLLATAVVAALPAAPHRATDERVPPGLQREIDAAIDRGVQHLLERQHRDGSWTGAVFGSYRTGPTAFSAYALLESGVPANAPAMRAALTYIERSRPTMVYSAGAALLMLGELGDAAPKLLAEQMLELLLDWESDEYPGTWAYPSGPVDLSNMQFVALGMWAADRLGLDVPLDVTRRLAEATSERFQEDPIEASELPPALAAGVRREGDVAGFHYFVDRDSRPPSGSMTAAGVCIQQIAQRIHGRKLGRKLTRSIEDSVALGTAWLGAHWSTAENLGHHEGGQLLYYLYALERVGSLMDSDAIDGHLWYEPGARQILSMQKDDGGWGRLHETAYALLFLNRASRGGVTGGPPEVDETVVRSESGPVHIVAAGSMDHSAWIEAIEDAEELRVRAVTWMLDGEPLETVDADGSSPWSGERFAIRWRAATAGTRSLAATVHGVDGDGSPVELIAEPLSVASYWSAEDWMAAAVGDRRSGIAIDEVATTTASSAAAGQHPERAVDGLEGTAWIASADDAEARIDIELDGGVRASAVSVSQAASSVATLDQFVGVQRIRLTVNGKSTEHTLPATTPAPIILPLDRRTKVRSLAIEILTPPTGRRGLAEIGLH